MKISLWIVSLLIVFLPSCGPPVYREITPLPSPTLLPEKEIAIPAFPSTTKRVILIDAGHGGEDFGARSTTKPYYQEKNLTLTTSKFLKRYLEELGFAAIMTRSEDLFVPLEKRARIANQLHPELFVSVHYNSAPSREAEGIEVYFFRTADDPSRVKASKQLAQAVLDKIIESTGARSRGVRHGNFLVIRETDMPAILIEGGFLTNTSEMDRIKDPTYLKKLAMGIAKGIQAYLESADRQIDR